VRQTRRRSYWSQLAVCGSKIFSKSTVVQTKISHVSKTTPLLGWFVILLARLNIVSLCTKFESSSFSHYWDMDGAPKIWNVSRDVATPLSGTVCHPSARTSYGQPVHQLWNLYVYSLQRYEKCKNGVICGLRVTQGHRKHRQLMECIRLPIRL